MCCIVSVPREMGITLKTYRSDNSLTAKEIFERIQNRISINNPPASPPVVIENTSAAVPIPGSVPDELQTLKLQLKPTKKITRGKK